MAGQLQRWSHIIDLMKEIYRTTSPTNYYYAASALLVALDCFPDLYPLDSSLVAMLLEANTLWRYYRTNLLIKDASIVHPCDRVFYRLYEPLTLVAQDSQATISARVLGRMLKGELYTCKASPSTDFSFLCEKLNLAQQDTCKEATCHVHLRKGLVLQESSSFNEMILSCPFNQCINVSIYQFYA